METTSLKFELVNSDVARSPLITVRRNSRLLAGVNFAPPFFSSAIRAATPSSIFLANRTSSSLSRSSY